MVKVRLKAIVYQCDFRKADKTLFRDFAVSPKYQGPLGANEAYLFVSSGEDQMVWWFRTVEIGTRRSSAEATHAYRTRLDSHSYWSPLMLSEYAQAVGIDLVGIRTFESAFKEQRENIRKRRVLEAKNGAKKTG